MDKPINRHDFMQSVARSGLLVALGGVGIAAVTGSKDVSECFNHNYCSSCWGHSSCTLPERKEVKIEREDENRPRPA